MNKENIWTDKYIIQNEKLEKKHLEKVRKELLKSENRRRHNEIVEIKKENKPKYVKLNKFTTTKVLIYLILLNCTLVEAYSMFVMYKLQDLSALYSLIGAVIGESITYAIYCAKSFKDTNAEENLKFEREKLNMCELSEDEQEELSDIIADDIPIDDDHSGDIPVDDIECGICDDNEED